MHAALLIVIGKYIYIYLHTARNDKLYSTLRTYNFKLIFCLQMYKQCKDTIKFYKQSVDRFFYPLQGISLYQGAFVTLYWKGSISVLILNVKCLINLGEDNGIYNITERMRPGIESMLMNIYYTSGDPIAQDWWSISDFKWHQPWIWQLANKLTAHIILISI